MDMREQSDFPRPPSTKEEVYDPGVDAWLLACALVGRHDCYQRNVYRGIWLKLGDDRFRDLLDETRIILSEPNKIRNRAAFLTRQLQAGLLEVGGTIGGEY